MEPPTVRPGSVASTEPVPRVVAFFPNAAEGNLAIQQLVGLGVRSDRLGVTTPDQISGHQGMVLSIPCPEPGLLNRVEALCRDLGAEIHRQRP